MHELDEFLAWFDEIERPKKERSSLLRWLGGRLPGSSKREIEVGKESSSPVQIVS